MDEKDQISGEEAQQAWSAFLERDRRQDGRFVIAVQTTGIYCRASCPARRPERKNVLFFRDGVRARAAGFRACLRCRPDDAARDDVAVRQAIAMIEESIEKAPNLAALAQKAGYSPYHFQRIFKRIMGVSPAAYARQFRGQKMERALLRNGEVTDAVYEAGYGSASSAYADAARRLGMTPGARKKGGAGEAVRFAVVESALGQMLVVATDKGVARISFDEGEADVRRFFPMAEIVPADAGFQQLVQDVVTMVADPASASHVDLPMDVRGTAFQQAVWQALRDIPAGETRSYSDIGHSIGRPNAVRAVGTACGDNRLAVLIPCHRVVRSDGGLGGYAYGLERKKNLLKCEGKNNL